MKNILSIFAISIFIFGCAESEKRPAAQVASKQRVLFATFEEAWRATHASLKYSIANENPDSGFIETEYIKSVDGWSPPEKKEKSNSGQRYKLVFIFARGKTEGRESTRVTIEKKIEVLKDFFSEAESKESDGMEEMVLFYRIEREILINAALKKAEASAKK